MTRFLELSGAVENRSFQGFQFPNEGEILGLDQEDQEHYLRVSEVDDELSLYSQITFLGGWKVAQVHHGFHDIYLLFLHLNTLLVSHGTSQRWRYYPGRRF